MMIRLLATVAVFLLCGGCGGTRQPTPVAPSDVPGLVALYETAGLEAAPMDDHSLVISREGLNVLVFLEDDGASLQAVLPCTRAGRGDPAEVNAWNASRRYGRAYLDENDGLGRHRRVQAEIAGQHRPGSSSTRCGLRLPPPGRSTSRARQRVAFINE